MANPMPNELMNTVVAKMYDIIVNGDGTTVPKSEDNFFSWASPGIPFDEADFEFLTQGLTGVIDPKSLLVKNPDGTESTRQLTDAERNELLGQDTSRLYSAAESFARIVDFVPDASGINDQMNRINIKADEGTLSDIYDFVLRFSQVANTELTEDDKAKIEKYRQLLQVEREKEDLVTGEKVKVLEPSPLVKAYNEKMQAWFDAALLYNNSRINALTASTPQSVHDFAINAPIYRSKVNFALNDWINNGYKNEFEGIAARIDQMSSRDLTILKAQYKDALERAKITGIMSGSDFYFSALAPANFYRSTGWTRFSFTNNDYSHYSNQTSSSWGGSAGFSVGFFSFGGTAGGSKSALNVQADSSRFAFSFEICQVPIIRPWFKSHFLNSKSWRFDANNPESKGDFLSDGSRPPAAGSMLPAYPTSMIFVRGLTLDFANSKSVYDSVQSSIGGGGAVGIGPFVIGGSYKKNNDEKKFSSHYDSQGIHVDGMQCIGFKCHMLQKAPNPNPDIKSWV